jgi:hypothetical protein
MDPGLKLSKQMEPKTDSEKVMMANKPFRQIVGSFMYLVMSTRPDLAYFTHEMSKFVNNPGPKHWSAIKGGLIYLKATQVYGLTLGLNQHDIKLNELSFTGYSYADFAMSEDRRSTAV